MNCVWRGRPAREGVECFHRKSAMPCATPPDDDDRAPCSCAAPGRRAVQIFVAACPGEMTESWPGM